MVWTWLHSQISHSCIFTRCKLPVMSSLCNTDVDRPLVERTRAKTSVLVISSAALHSYRHFYNPCVCVGGGSTQTMTNVSFCFSHKLPFLTLPKADFPKVSPSWLLFASMPTLCRPLLFFGWKCCPPVMRSMLVFSLLSLLLALACSCIVDWGSLLVHSVH